MKLTDTNNLFNSVPKIPKSWQFLGTIVDFMYLDFLIAHCGS